MVAALAAVLESDMSNLHKLGLSEARINEYLI